MAPDLFDCPEGYTCIWRIYPSWHDWAWLGFAIFIILAALVFLMIVRER